MRVQLTFGAVIVLCVLAVQARASELEYWPIGPAAEATVAGGGRTWNGYRLEPGQQLSVRVKGGGTFRAFYFQQYEPGRPFPTDVRLLVAVDGAGKMFPLLPKPLPGMSFPGRAKGSRAIPSAPMPVTLRLGPGEHSIVYKLAATVSAGGVLAFPDARRRQSGLELALDLDVEPELPDLELALDLAPEPVEALDLDLDLALPVDDGKPTAVAALDLPLDDGLPELDLELDLDAPAAKPAAEPVKQPVTVAAATPRPQPSAPTRPTTPPPATRPAPGQTKAPQPPPAVALVTSAVEPEEKRAPPRPSRPLLGPPPKLGPIEIGARGGWALARGRLHGGQPIYLAEIGWRLEEAGLPKLRLTLVTGYTAIDATWRGIEPGLGLGSFHQTSRVVPLELGATFEPLQGRRLSPYLGLSAGAGVASTRLQRFSLSGQTTQAPAPGVTASAGLRFQLGQASLVLELRHNESFTSLRALGRPGVQVGQPTLSNTAALAGLLLAI